MNRLDLQTKFENILGSHNVYFQPPASLHMEYPAIVYSLKNIVQDFADNLSYIKASGFEVILIDKNPDSEFVYKILELPYCSFDRHYTANNLNHFAFNIYNLKGGINNETDLGRDW